MKMEVTIYIRYDSNEIAKLKKKLKLHVKLHISMFLSDINSSDVNVSLLYLPNAM